MVTVRSEPFLVVLFNMRGKCNIASRKVFYIIFLIHINFQMTLFTNNVHTVFCLTASSAQSGKKSVLRHTPSHNALKSIVCDKKLLNDLPYFIKFKQSGNLEVFPNVLTKFCPKRLSFTPDGMEARTQVAI